MSALLTAGAPAQEAVPYFGIRIVDGETGAPVPLMELRTVNEQRFLSDNAGWIAFHEPGLMDREVFFHVSGAGYEMKKDGFGFAGVRLTPSSGKTSEVKVRRTNIAHRIGRLTGQGLYRDSALLEKPCPLPNLTAAGIMGQDSVQAVSWRGGIFWLWGDTNVAGYPLGNYHTTCATSSAALHGDQPIAFDYFIDPARLSHPRRMLPLEGPGAVWLFGLLTVSGGEKERMFCHYGRYPGLAPALEQGIAEFDETKGVFVPVRNLPLDEKWRHPRGHAVRVKDAEGDWFYFCSPLPHTRVPAAAEAVTDPVKYQGLRWNESTAAWQWQTTEEPTTQYQEATLVSAGKLPPGIARWQLVSPEGKPVRIHTGSVQWNAWRSRWALTGVQSGGRDDPSALGEMWYAEAPYPAGPWRKAVKIASHPRYTFYNPIHHGFLDREGGRIIYFEGTWTAEFSGNPVRTPRADYNQVLYRLDLSDPALKAAQ